MADESNYLDIIEKNRSGGVEHAATTPVFYEKPARRRLTKARKRAKLSSSASGQKGKAKSRRRTTKSLSARRSPKMASKKQKAAARRNIKKAQAAKRAKAASRSRAAKKAARTRKSKHSHRAARKATKHTARKARKSSKRSRAAKKAARTRKANKAARSRAARKASKSRKSRKSSRRPKHSRKARKSSRRSRKTKRSVSFRLPRKARKVYVVAAEKRRGRRHGGGRRRGAMENPMTGVEIFVGSITGLAGFGLADFVDRMLATHALTDKNTKDANGQELYADNPPTDGNYVGLFNPTAICAPMDWKRWVFGLLGAAVPLGAAQLVSGPTARSALQFFGFGYGVRVVGKGVIDGLALLTKSTGMGQRLYDGEMRAAVLKANNGNNQANELASLPAAGLGASKQLAGAPCKDCGDKQQAAGAGYPSMPREVASQTQPQPPTSQATPPAPPPSPATPPAFNPGPLTGTPKNGAAKKRSPFAWGEDIR